MDNKSKPVPAWKENLSALAVFACVAVAYSNADKAASLIVDQLTSPVKTPVIQLKP